MHTNIYIFHYKCRLVQTVIIVIHQKQVAVAKITDQPGFIRINQGPVMMWIVACHQKPQPKTIVITMLQITEVVRLKPIVLLVELASVRRNLTGRVLGQVGIGITS